MCDFLFTAKPVFMIFIVEEDHLTNFKNCYHHTNKMGIPDSKILMLLVEQHDANNKMYNCGENKSVILIAHMSINQSAKEKYEI